MIHNPEFLRNVWTQLTPRRALFAGGLTILLIVITFFLTWSATEPTRYSSIDYDRWQAFGEASFNLLILGQFVLLHIVATSVVGGSMVQERMRGTLIFQQMTLLSSHEVLLGKIFGSTILYYFLAALIMPFSLVTALLARIELTNLFWIYTLLIVGGICWQAVALFLSCSMASTTEAAGRNLMGLCYSIGGLASIVSLMIFGGLWSRHWFMNKETFNFYGLPISAFTLTLMIMVFIGFWAYAGAVRAFKELQLIKLSPRPVWYFFGSLEALMLGLFWGAISPIDEKSSYYQGYYYRDAIGLVLTYISINWMALTVLAGVSAVNRNQLREWWSAGQDAISMLKRTELRNALVTYPIAVGISIIGFIALWFSLSRKLTLLENQPDFHFNFGAMMVAVFAFALTMTAMAAFIQFWAMFRFRVANRAGVALWVLFFIVAGIAAGILGEGSVPAMLNPLVLTATILDNPSELAYVVEGIIVQFGFAAICMGMASWKWRKTRHELLAN